MIRKILDWLTSRQGGAIRTGNAGGKPASSQFGSVSLIAGSNCCDAAAKLVGERILMSRAPALPLDGCSHDNCHCRFEKHGDRRDGEDRRLAGMLQSTAWYGGAEKRGSKGRRSDDS